MIKPWYKLVHAHSPNPHYKNQEVRIYSGVAGLPGIFVSVCNGKIARVKFFAFRSIHTVKDVRWVVNNQHAFEAWLEQIQPIKKMQTLDELFVHLERLGLERRADATSN